MVKSAVALGSRLYKVPLLYDVSKASSDLFLYFPTNHLLAQSGSYSGDAPLTATALSLGFGANYLLEFSLYSGVGEVFYEWHVDYAQYMTKFLAFLILRNYSGNAGAATITIRLLLVYPDVRGQEQVFSITFTTPSINANTNSQYLFPPMYTWKLLPEGTRIRIGVTITSGGASAHQVVCVDQCTASYFQFKMSPIVSSALPMAQSSRTT